MLIYIALVFQTLFLFELVLSLDVDKITQTIMSTDSTTLFNQILISLKN